MCVNIQTVDKIWSMDGLDNTQEMLDSANENLNNMCIFNFLKMKERQRGTVPFIFFFFSERNLTTYSPLL